MRPDSEVRQASRLKHDVSLPKDRYRCARNLGYVRLGQDSFQLQLLGFVIRTEFYTDTHAPNNMSSRLQLRNNKGPSPYFVFHPTCLSQ